LQFCHENLPLYKMPKDIHFVSSLPKTDSGKIKKAELKKVEEEFVAKSGRYLNEDEKEYFKKGIRERLGI